ncbi:hypothetical protein NT6N_06110 [Oceaniferula spumae]|uniref:Orc1-like AAA ATPase domain-containing protein n=1 Tax=Oceaniferula spumae TaxID=2979115 RepID=A0AAT9FHU4_9BACT
MAKTAGNPFDHAFEMLGHAPDVATDCINSEALELLTQALTSRAGDRGRMVLLRSPRAGFGKTHLLMRLHQRVAHTHEFIPLEPSKGRYLDASAVLDAVLRRFSRILPGGGGLTVLDLLARRILATGLEPLVCSGEVPSQDRESALQALQERPVETFDFHNEEAVTALWAQANFGLLGPRLTAELAERTQAGFRPVAWWVELLFRYSSAPLDQTTRNSSLVETVFGADAVETDMHEKLVTLLNLTGLVTSPVLVLDEVEGFSSNPEAALQVATFLNALHQSCNELALIISVNGDVWETAFLPRMPCGLKDRLSDIVIDLKPMTKEQAAKLLRDRAGDHADQILDRMDLDTGVIYARGLIREASNMWAELEMQASAPATGSQTSQTSDFATAAQTPISLATPTPEPTPEPAPDPTPTPEPTPAPEPVQQAETSPQPTTAQEPVAPAAPTEAQPAPSPQPESTAPEPAPTEPFTQVVAEQKSPEPAAEVKPRITSDVISAAAAAAAAIETSELETYSQQPAGHMATDMASPFEPVADYKPAPTNPVASDHSQGIMSPFQEADSQETDEDDDSEGLPYFENVEEAQFNYQPEPTAPQSTGVFEPVQPASEPVAAQVTEPRAFADESKTEEPAQQDSPFTYADNREQHEAPAPITPPQEPIQAVEDSPFTPVEPSAPQRDSAKSSQPAASPFSIDTDANPVSPFQPVTPVQPAHPVQPVQPVANQVQPPQAQPAASPQPEPPASTFGQAHENPPKPHVVTSGDQEKVEDLLRQFRDRYGREE